MLTVSEDAGIFASLPEKFAVWMSHGDSVTALPQGFAAVSHTENTSVAAMHNLDMGIVGVQFHPEVVHSDFGTEMLRNFLFGVAKAKGEWQMGSFVETATKAIREKVGDEEVICGLSGGG